MREGEATKGMDRRGPTRRSRNQTEEWPRKGAKGIARRSRAAKKGRKGNRRGAENAEVRREENPSEAVDEVLAVVGDFG